jgi:hypothetical protein
MPPCLCHPKQCSMSSPLAVHTGFHGHLPQLVHLGLARLTSATPQLSQLAPRLCSLVVTQGASDSGVTR